MAINLFSILRRKITKYDELLDNDLQTLADAIDNIAPKAPTLQDVTNEGNITTNDINLDKSAIVLANGSRLLEGIIDNGASGGIARECAVLYQDQWENGIQYFINQAARIVQATSINNTVPDANLDITRGYDVNSIFYDLNSNQKYICTDNTEAAAVWDLFFDAVATDGVTITGDGTLGNPLVASGGGGAVNYANVLFVDSTNGNNGTAAQNDFTKPYSDTNPAMNAAALLSPTATNRTLIYVRRGNYGSFINLQDNTDWYCEPGVVFTNVSVLDNGVSLNAKFMGKAVFTGYGFQAGGLIFRANGATSKVYFEFDEISTTGGVIEINSGASATIVGRKIFSETFNKGFGITTRGSGTVTINVTEEIAAWHQVFAVRAFSGKLYVTCPRIYLHEGNTYGGDFKQVIAIRDSLGGEVVINGDLIVNPLAGYYGGISGAITRWTDSWGTLRLNGNIYAENQFGVYGLGSSGASRTIINGDVRSNNLCAYVASNSSVVFRNGTLMNWNNLVGVSEGYPVFSMGGSGKVWVENCHMYSLGTGATQPNIAAVWKDTTASQLCINNTVHSGSDAIGFFVRNSAPAQPVNNVRIMNSRSTKPNDTNITDLLSPTGFVQDPNIIAIGFI
jgi:hypothetical protein